MTISLLDIVYLLLLPSSVGLESVDPPAERIATLFIVHIQRSPIEFCCSLSDPIRLAVTVPFEIFDFPLLAFYLLLLLREFVLLLIMFQFLALKLISDKRAGS